MLYRVYVQRIFAEQSAEWQSPLYICSSYTLNSVDRGHGGLIGDQKNGGAELDVLSRIQKARHVEQYTENIQSLQEISSSKSTTKKVLSVPSTLWLQNLESSKPYRKQTFRFICK